MVRLVAILRGQLAMLPQYLCGRQLLFRVARAVRRDLRRCPASMAWRAKAFWSGLK